MALNHTNGLSVALFDVILFLELQVMVKKSVSVSILYRWVNRAMPNLKINIQR